MKECFICGAKELEVIKDQPYTYEDGGIEVTITGLTQYRCKGCGETFTPIPKPQLLHKAIGLVICEENKSLLTGNEIRFLRKAMELKAVDLAQIMGTDVSTISRWENNKKTIGDSNDRLLRTLFIMKSQTRAKQEEMVNSLKSMPSKRKEIKEKHVLSMNPPEWLMDPCCCPA